MSSILTAQFKLLPEWLREWLPILLGLLALYLPTYYFLSTGLWNSEDQGHGPIVLMVILFLIWKNRANLHHNSENLNRPLLGGLLLTFGLLCYVIGRSQDVILLEISSQIPVHRFIRLRHFQLIVLPCERCVLATQFMLSTLHSTIIRAVFTSSVRSAIYLYTP